ncbi:MAG: TylF/MycF/NovP-related O-methyltransferase [Desulfarculaceae bacterium]|jgi:hypothetical protein
MFYGLKNDEQRNLFFTALWLIRRVYKRVFQQDHLITVERCMGFMDDPEFMKAFKKAAQNKQERSLIWRIHTLAWAARHCLNLKGDFVECGVYRGFSSFFLAHYLDFNSQKRSFYLYDTFAGIPEGYGNGSPVKEGAHGEKGLYEEVKQKFSPFKNVEVVKGIVPEVFKKVCPKKIAFLHIDMNSAKAEVGALEGLFDLLVPGGMLVLDDYGWQWYRAQKEAEDVFFKKRGYSVLEIPTGQGLVIKR